MAKTINHMISDIVGTFTDPIIVFPGGWGDTLPEWIKTQITIERMAESMKEARGEQPSGTDAEATAYLYTASLVAPMGRDWTKIYLYVAGKTYTCANRGGEFPEDIKVQTLNEEQMAELKRLKEWLYRKRVQIRQDRKRAERRQEKEEEAARMKAAQPALFDF